MRSTIQGVTRSLEHSLQVYCRLTRVPVSQRTRRTYLTARENRRSALPLLREGIAHSCELEHMMVMMAEAQEPISVMEMSTTRYPYKSLSTQMSRLFRLLQRYEMVRENAWLVRTGEPVRPCGLQYRYRLTPQGHAIMRVEVDES